MIKVGLVCVGQYNLEWHRCLILELKDDLAKVNFSTLMKTLVMVTKITVTR